jgi:hypothetical protein
MSEILNGVPSSVLLPARPYTWKRVKGPIALKIPIRGKYEEMFPELEKEVSTSPKGDFDCFLEMQKENGSGTVQVLDYSKIIFLLFLSKQYLDLSDSQVFSISSIVLDEKINELNVIGHVLDRAE